MAELQSSNSKRSGASNRTTKVVRKETLTHAFVQKVGPGAAIDGAWWSMALMAPSATSGSGGQTSVRIKWQAVAANAVGYVRAMTLQWLDNKEAILRGRLRAKKAEKKHGAALSEDITKMEELEAKFKKARPLLIDKGRNPLDIFPSSTFEVTSISSGSARSVQGVAVKPRKAVPKHGAGGTQVLDGMWQTQSQEDDALLEMLEVENMREQCYNMLCVELSKQMFRVLDRDADGLVTYEELLRAFAMLGLPDKSDDAENGGDVQTDGCVKLPFRAVSGQKKKQRQLLEVRTVLQSLLAKLEGISDDGHTVYWKRAINRTELETALKNNPTHTGGAHAFYGEYIFAISMVLQVFVSKNETCLVSPLLLPLIYCVWAIMSVGVYFLVQEWIDFEDFAPSPERAYVGQELKYGFFLYGLAAIHLFLLLFSLFPYITRYFVPHTDMTFIKRHLPLAQLYWQSVTHSKTADVTRIKKRIWIPLFHLTGIVILFNMSMLVWTGTYFKTHFIAVGSYCGAYVAWLIVFSLQLLTGSVHRTNGGQLAYLRNLVELKYLKIVESQDATEARPALPNEDVDSNDGSKQDPTSAAAASPLTQEDACGVVAQLMDISHVRATLETMVAKRWKVALMVIFVCFITFALSTIIFFLPYLFAGNAEKVRAAEVAEDPTLRNEPPPPAASMRWNLSRDWLPLTLHFASMVVIIAAAQIEFLESMFGLLRAASGVRQCADLLDVNVFTSSVVFLHHPDNLRAWRAVLHHVRSFEYASEFTRSGRVVSVISIIYGIAIATVIAFGPRASLREPLFTCVVIGSLAIALYNGVQLLFVLYCGSLIDIEQKRLVKALLDERLNMRLRLAALHRRGHHSGALGASDTHDVDDPIELLTDAISNIEAHAEPVRLLGVLPLTQQTVSGLVSLIISLFIAGMIRVFNQNG